MSSERSIRSRLDDATDLSHDAFHARINRFCKGLISGASAAARVVRLLNMAFERLMRTHKKETL
jgi:hypothetical protein